MKAEITFDLVMAEDMPFVEGCYRLAGGIWQVFIFRRSNGIEEVGIKQNLILGRAHYDDEDPGRRLRQTNEAVHRLAGHLVDLCDPAEAFTESRATGIGEQLVLLHASAITRIYSLAV